MKAKTLTAFIGIIAGGAVFLFAFGQRTHDFVIGNPPSDTAHAMNELLVAQMAVQTQTPVLPQEPLPTPTPAKEPIPELTAKSAYSVFVPIDNLQNQQVLFEKNAAEPLPIASIAKLLTAVVAIEQYPLEAPVVISKEAVAEKETAGQLKEGDVLTVEELLYPLLIESSNDAAFALAEIMGEKQFVAQMNLKANALDLSSAYFMNPSGLDPEAPGAMPNTASAKDVAVLTEYILKTHPRIFDILSYRAFHLYTSQGIFHHTLFTTNELLSFEGWPAKVIGGKTGLTPLAKGNLVIVLKAPNQNGYIINIVLGSDKRFEDMKMLIDWVFTTK